MGREPMTVEAVVEATRGRATLFESDARGWLEVSGEDRVRWLDGMISGDVAALERGPDGSGCHALLLTNRGAIVADLHVARIGDIYVLESERSEIPRIAAVLDRFLIADDVRLEDRSALFACLGLEGPAAPRLLTAALEAGAGGGPAVEREAGAGGVPAPDAWRVARLAGHEVLVGAFGWSGEAAYQLRVPLAGREAVAAALDTAAGGVLPRGSQETLEVLRVEAGIPAFGRELDEEVLPPEARLERAICPTKGCYVGQEIVARLRARGQVNHLLVGVSLETAELPAPGVELVAGGRRTGELTSVVRSPARGPIALGYVRREHAEAGTRVEFEGGAGRVESLPFVAVGAAPGAPEPD